MKKNRQQRIPIKAQSGLTLCQICGKEIVGESHYIKTKRGTTLHLTSVGGGDRRKNGRIRIIQIMLYG